MTDSKYTARNLSVGGMIRDLLAAALFWLATAIATAEWKRAVNCALKNRR
jgi:hypothetical protein